MVKKLFFFRNVLIMILKTFNSKFFRSWERELEEILLTTWLEELVYLYSDWSISTEDMDLKYTYTTLFKVQVNFKLLVRFTWTMKLLWASVIPQFLIGVVYPRGVTAHYLNWWFEENIMFYLSSFLWNIQVQHV